MERKRIAVDVQAARSLCLQQFSREEIAKIVNKCVEDKHTPRLQTLLPLTAKHLPRTFLLEAFALYKRLQK
jgi:hypothetical protein